MFSSEIIEKLRQVVNSMCNAIESIAEQSSDLPEGTGEVARFELMKFMMYLSASDGTIQWEEADVINDICGVNLNLTPSNLGNYIRENNIYSTDFETTVPTSFVIAVAVDNALVQSGEEPSVSEAMIDAYKAVGQALIHSDDDVDDNEVSDFNIYIRMLEKYREKNLSTSKNLSSGFKKNVGGVSAPSKGGVAAPKKG